MLINVNKGKLKIGAREGQTLRDAFALNEITLGVCGGKGVCGKCKVKVSGVAAALSKAEENKLTADEIADGYRLACQVPATDGLEVELDENMIARKDFSAVCSKITPLTADIRMFRFEMPLSQSLDYVPGQYVQLITPANIDGSPSVTRTFSISSDPADKSYFELIIRRTPSGDCTKYLFEKLQTGTTLDFIGPDGDFSLTESQRPMIFIAGGSGMSAIRCLLFELKRIQSKRKVIYFFGAPSPEGLYMTEQMKQFERQLDDFRFVPCVQQDQDGNWHGCKGLVTEVAADSLKDVAEYEAYLCGAPGMIKASIEVLEGMGVDRSRIFYDSFG